METTGRIKDMNRDWKTGNVVLILELDSSGSEELQKISEYPKLSVKIGRYTEKRSLSANAYFHVLVNRIATILSAPLTEVKNRLIREYGAFEYIDGQIPTFRLKAQYEDAILNREDMHVKPISRETDDGVEWVRFAFMRGSHTYNTAEMSRLIDGAVEEAKELGIETLPPAEIERMKETWKG